MFTGIVTDIGEVSTVEAKADGLRRIVILCNYDRDSIAIGASIACSGVCLTVVETGLSGNRTWFAVDAAAETAAVTNARDWAVGTRLNLERALKIGDELGGHIVSGHVDGMAEIVKVEEEGDAVRYTLRAPAGHAKFVAQKGSVALDGTSLTVNKVDGDLFDVLLIRHTLEVTTWGERKAGDFVNFEADTMARYAARLREFE